MTILKIKLDHVTAEVGALLLTVGLLHWLFELRLRRQMFADVAAAVLGNQRLHDNGLTDCLLNSKEVAEPAHWETAPELIIGIQYSARFFDDNHELIRRRSKKGLCTKVLVLNPESQAAEWLRATQTGFANVKEGVERISEIVSDADENRGNVSLLLHERVLRYSFIATREIVWIKFFTNERLRSSVPAFQVRCDSSLFDFFWRDISELMKRSKGEG
ncbi:MAG: hypothetical protein GY854_33005 [Deltaproteobacteria bacterium]|nr:hypothetical protein [Deltaproteobacteria bacterium]